jgi:hypothetical protein
MAVKRRHLYRAKQAKSRENAAEKIEAENVKGPALRPDLLKTGFKRRQY